MNFLHSFYPSSILFAFGPVAIHWYGICMAAGIGVAYIFTRRIFRAAGIGIDIVDRLTIQLLIGGFIGARLYHITNELPYYIAHPFDMMAVWKGGLAIHGALIGGGITLCGFIINNAKDILAIASFKHATPWMQGAFVSWLYFADLLVPGLAIGQAIGRWGNYFNQELYGSPTTLPWGIPINAIKRVPGFEGNIFFHPTFLYESVWLLVGACVLYFFVLHGVRKTSYAVGRGFFSYLVFAGAGRALIEFLRIDFMPVLFGVRLQQIVSVLLICIGIVGILWTLRNRASPHGAVST